MKKAEVERFVRRYSPMKRIRVVFCSRAEMNGYSGEIEPIYTPNRQGFEQVIMTFDRGYIARTADIRVKAMLLHEIGHIMTLKGTKGIIRREVEAHLWATNEAHRQKWKLIQNELINQMLWYSLGPCKKNNRRYVLAARQFLPRVSEDIPELKEAFKMWKEKWQNLL